MKSEFSGLHPDHPMRKAWEAYSNNRSGVTHANEAGFKIAFENGWHGACEAFRLRETSPDRELQVIVIGCAAIIFAVGVLIGGWLL